MAKFNAYLRFDGQCREAFGFYKEVFDGQLELQTLGESPMREQVPAERQHLVMHAVLTTPGFTLMGSDMVEDGLQTGNRVCLTLICESDAEIQRLYQHLATDGQVKKELKTEFWGGTFAIVHDRYGFEWMLEHSAAK